MQHCANVLWKQESTRRSCKAYSIKIQNIGRANNNINSPGLILSSRNLACKTQRKRSNNCSYTTHQLDDTRHLDLEFNHIRRQAIASKVQGRKQATNLAPSLLKEWTDDQRSLMQITQQELKFFGRFVKQNGITLFSNSSITKQLRHFNRMFTGNLPNLIENSCQRINTSTDVRHAKAK